MSITITSRFVTVAALCLWTHAATAVNAIELHAKAERENLSSRPEWQALLHVEKGTDGEGVSYIDDRAFFLSPVGHVDPEAELQATLTGLLNDPLVRCRYPARYEWLSGELDLSAQPVARQECPEYLNWRQTLNATDAVIVFASSYVNSPSSMYGHTFLRFDPPDLNESTPLLSYALNFGARVDEDENGLLYAWRGIAGGYPGQFAANRYLDKTKEYSRLENRDLWEYHLALTPGEVDRMLAHVWELDKINFDYFFFDENCSYRLLELIEVARPGLDITSEFGAFAIPIDTVKAVDNADLIDRVYFRPSNQSVVTYNINRLNRANQRMARRLADDIAVMESSEFAALDEPTKTKVAYTAYKFLRYEEGDEVGRDEAVASRSFELLRYLSARDLKSLQAQKPPAPTDPLLGHGTMMVSLSGGAEDGKWFSDLEWRLAYHDLLDDDEGYPADTSLNMGRLILRYRETDGLQLQRLDLVEITSTPPRDQFFKPLAWQTSVGFDRQWTNGDDELTFQGNGGVGLGYMSLFGGHLVGMLRGRAEYNDGFRDSKVDVAAGGSVMYILQRPRINTVLLFESLHFVGGTDRQLIDLQQNYSLTRNQAIRVNFKRSIDESKGYNEAGLAYRFYF